MLAARSNKQGSVFGQPVDLGAVKGAHSTYSVDASATGAALDVFGQFGVGTGTDVSTFVTRTMPGLSSSPTRVRHLVSSR